MAGTRMNLTINLGKKRANEAFRAVTALWKELPPYHIRFRVARIAASACRSPPVGWRWRCRTGWTVERRVRGRSPAARTRPLMSKEGRSGIRGVDCRCSRSGGRQTRPGDGDNGFALVKHPISKVRCEVASDSGRCWCHASRII